jgi:hypothetical protein
VAAASGYWGAPAAAGDESARLLLTRSRHPLSYWVVSIIGITAGIVAPSTPDEARQAVVEAAASTQPAAAPRYRRP